MVSWFETMTGFLMTEVLASEALLTNAVEDFLDTALVRVEALQGTISPARSRSLWDSYSLLLFDIWIFLKKSFWQLAFYKM